MSYETALPSSYEFFSKQPIVSQFFCSQTWTQRHQELELTTFMFWLYSVVLVFFFFFLEALTIYHLCMVQNSSIGGPMAAGKSWLIHISFQQYSSKIKFEFFSPKIEKNIQKSCRVLENDIFFLFLSRVNNKHVSDHLMPCGSGPW